MCSVLTIPTQKLCLYTNVFNLEYHHTGNAFSDGKFTLILYYYTKGYDF